MNRLNLTYKGETRVIPVTDNYYERIAKHINDMIPTSWDSFYYLGEVERDKRSWSSVFYFVDAKSKELIKSHSIPKIYNVSEEIYLLVLDELNQIMLALYDSFIANEQAPWEQVSITVDNNGKFNAEFCYDVMGRQNSSQVRREVIWAYNAFGLVPKEGSYTRKLLDEYLEEEYASEQSETKKTVG